MPAASCKVTSPFMQAAVTGALLIGALPGIALGQAVDAPLPHADQLHREAIVIDGHNDVTSWILDCGFDLGMDGADAAKHDAERWWILGRFLPLPSGDRLRTHTDLRRLVAGGVDAQFFSIFPDPRRFPSGEQSRERAIEMIEALKEQIRRHADRLLLAVSTHDIREIARAGKIAALMGLEGGHAIDDDLGNVERFYDLGIRYMTLTWSNTNGWADSSDDARRHGGLAPFGTEVVREMNRLGMMVDVSHVSDETFWDAVATSAAPIIASHSAARALVNIPRNLSDEMIRAVAANGGVVMVNFGGAFIDSRKAGTWKIVQDVVLHLGPSQTPLDRLLDHIDHVARVGGVDHVGLGSDFDGTLFLPEGVSDVSGFPSITAGLLARGYSADDVRKILGENLLRSFAAVEAVAARLQRAPGSPVELRRDR